MEVVRRCRLEDEGYGGVSCVNMSAQWVSARVPSERVRMPGVLSEFQDRFCSMGRIFFLHQQYVPWWGRPAER